MMHHSRAWYRNFWPWFIVGLLGISVLASLYTVSVAYNLGNLEVGESGAVARPSAAAERAVDSR